MAELPYRNEGQEDKTGLLRKVGITGRGKVKRRVKKGRYS
jgi:hypothetical protein